MKLNKWIKILIAQILLSLFLLICGYPVLGNVLTSWVWFLGTLGILLKFLGGVSGILELMFPFDKPTHGSGLGLALISWICVFANGAVYLGIKAILYLVFGFDF